VAEPPLNENDVSPDRRTLRTVLRDMFRSRAISLIDCPLTKCSRRIRPIFPQSASPPPLQIEAAAHRPKFRGQFGRRSPGSGVKLHAAKHHLPRHLRLYRGIDAVRAEAVSPEPWRRRAQLQSVASIIEQGSMARRAAHRGRRTDPAHNIRGSPTTIEENDVAAASHDRSTARVGWRAWPRACANCRPILKARLSTTWSGSDPARHEMTLRQRAVRARAGPPSCATWRP